MSHFRITKLLLLITIFSSLASYTLIAGGGVGIVDLDTVAKELGVMEHISVTLKNKKAELDDQLKTLRGNLQANMNQVIKEAGDSPSDEEKKKIMATNRDLQKRLSQAQARADKIIQSEKLRLIREFRNELRPHALAVAKQKKLSVVLNKVMPPVYTFDSSADITSELTIVARKAGLQRKPPILKY